MLSIMESENSNGGVLASAYDAVTDLVTGSSIPAPIKKNAFKAFGQLCTAAIDIPVSYLEGIATEKRAETQARVKIISTGADQIAKQMDVDPEFARVAVKKYGQKIVREQVNLDKVSEIAAHQIHQDVVHSKTKSDETTDILPINEDWLNNFEKEASQKSTEEMQLLFGRILAGEIQRPSSFSIKTVKLLGELDSHAATLFRHFCSLCVSLKVDTIYIDARVPSLGGHPSQNALQNYGLGFGQLNILHEYGLIIPDYDSYMDYRMCIANENNQVGLPFSHQNRNYGLLPSTERPNNQEFRLAGVALSRSGTELLKIVDIEPSNNYMTALMEYFAGQNLHMLEITN
ncbi:MAG: hypothetical protein RLZZ04_4293 [Cyanobacteriota bacterium]|jgi:hypothetical protein